jgi:hypothetical protein
MATPDVKYREASNSFKRLVKSADEEINRAINFYKKDQNRRQLEVELRFKDVAPTEFFRISDYLKNSEEFKDGIIENTTDYSIGSERFSLIHETDTVKQIKKSNFAKKDDDDWNTRLNVNVEEEKRLDPNFTRKDLEKSKYVREKERVSYVRKDETFKVDVTKISTLDKNLNRYKKIVTHECEIEFIKLNPASVKDAASVVAEIFNVKQRSELAYTEAQKRTMIEFLNKTLKGINNKKDFLDHTYMPQARNLKFEDLVYGGIIGNETRYTITMKADGERQQLFFYNGQIWMIFPSYDFNLIAIVTGGFAQKTHGYLIEGEDIPRIKRKKWNKVETLHMFIPFDLLLQPVFVGNNRSKIKVSDEIQEKDHTLRLERARSVIKSLGKNFVQTGITFVDKEFIQVGDTFESLSEARLKILALEKESPYETDGAIITPDNFRYNIGSDGYPIEKRVLSSMPDICKLKPWKKLTIDLKIDKKDGNINLLAMGRSELENFSGSFRNAFSVKNNIDKRSKLFETVKQDQIVEFKPRKAKRGDERVTVLLPFNIRHNKTIPNRTDYAAAIWDDISDPITDDIFRGNSDRLQRKSFNLIKKDLYRNIPEDADVFEIGSGNGGQMTKWLNYHKVLGVEPDIEHINEMKRRIEGFDSKKKSEKRRGKKYIPLADKVKVIHGGAEETDKIVKNAVNWFGWDDEIGDFYIVSMLSLSFFWRDDKMLSGFVSTIRELTKAYREAGGKRVYFVYMTIEGGRVTKLFDENKNVKQISDDTRHLKLGPIDMKFEQGESSGPVLYIDIENSIVDNQTEYLVNMEHLQKYIPLIDVENKTIRIEKCMSLSERTYAGLFTSGVVEIGDLGDADTFDISDGSDEKKEPSEEKVQEKNGSDLIVFRYNGRSDFLTRRPWLETRVHEEKDEFVSESKKEALPAYHQEFFGLANDEKEFQSLGALVIDDKHQTTPSFVNAILSAVDEEYQQTEDRNKRIKICKKFFNDTTDKLSSETKFPSDAAKILNPLVKGWMTMDLLWEYAVSYSKGEGILPDDMEVVTVEDEKDILFSVMYYIGENIVEREPIGDDFVVYSEEMTEYKNYEIENVENFEDLLIDENGEIPENVVMTEIIYKWKNPIYTKESLVDGITNEQFHKMLLFEDNIDEDSVFYNCRGGYLFRYYHANGWGLGQVKENLKLESRYKYMFQYAYFADVLGIAIKTFAMPDEDDNTEDKTYFNPIEIVKSRGPDPDSVGKIVKNPEAYEDTKARRLKKKNQSNVITGRNFCIPKGKFSFYPTTLKCSAKNLKYYKELWEESETGSVDSAIEDAGGFASFEFWDGYGDKECESRLMKQVPTIYVYYHHFDPVFDSDMVFGIGGWADKDTHTTKEGLIVKDEKDELSGLFIPLGQLVEEKDEDFVRTVFTD